jgi:tetratricopeptide (TPR) repeat protein
MRSSAMDDRPDPDIPSDRHVYITGSQGFQVGDHNVQINFLFSGKQPIGPVVAGSVPHAPPAFQPREDLMTTLREAGPGVSVVRAVTGMRGVGKTQLAAAYARERINAGWRLVAWVNAEDTTGILNGLAVVADRLDISRPGTPLEAIGGEVRNRLEADGERCLIVYDNVIDPDAVRPYVPSAGKSQVVVTSAQASALILGRPTQVSVFTEQESLDFLTERTHLIDIEGAMTLAREVGHLPLALTQAAAVIQTQRLSYPVYLTRLRTYPAQRYLPPAKGDSYKRGVAETIGLSIDTVTAGDLSGRCNDLLAIISLLSPDGVARDLLYGAEPAGQPGGAPGVDEALARLAEASLLTFSGVDGSQPMVTAHRLIMRVTRERRALDGTLAAIGAKACELLAAAADSLGEPLQHQPAARDLVRQVMALNDNLAPHIAVDDIALTEKLLSRRTWALGCLVDLDDSASQAADLGEPLVAELERVLGGSHPDTLTSRNNLAYAYQAAGRVGEAIALYERTLADRELVLGESHPDTLDSRNNLGLAYRVAGRVGEAIALYERTLADRELVLGESHPDTLNSRNNLAEVYRASGRVADAVLLHERTLADRARVLGESHPRTLMSRNNLGLAYRVAGRVDEAIPLLERTLADSVRVLGESHPDTLMARNSLGLAYREGGQAREAVPLFERTLADTERMLGESHPNTLASQSNLASAYRATGRVREAIPLYEASLAGFERIFGTDHPSAVRVRKVLAETQREAEGHETGSGSLR